MADPNPPPPPTDADTALSPISPVGSTDIPVELDSVQLTEDEAAKAAVEGDAPTDGDRDSMEPMSRDVEGGAGWQRAEERAKQQAERSRDPAVLVNIPKGPAAQDYEVAALHTERPEGADAVAAEGATVGAEGQANGTAARAEE